MADNNKTALWFGLGCVVLVVIAVACVVASIAIPFIGNTARTVEATEATEEWVVDPNTSFGTNVPPNYKSLRGGTWAFAVPDTWREARVRPGVLKGAFPRKLFRKRQLGL